MSDTCHCNVCGRTIHFHNGLREIGASQIRERLRSYLASVRDTGERLVITRRGKAVAALVSVDDLRFLERMEDILDVAKRINDEAIPLDQALKELAHKETLDEATD